MTNRANHLRTVAQTWEASAFCGAPNCKRTFTRHGREGKKLGESGHYCFGKTRWKCLLGEIRVFGKLATQKSEWAWRKNQCQVVMSWGLVKLLFPMSLEKLKTPYLHQLSHQYPNNFWMVSQSFLKEVSSICRSQLCPCRLWSHWLLADLVPRWSRLPSGSLQRLFG